MIPVPPLMRSPPQAARIALIADSHWRLVGKRLVARTGDIIEAMWHAPQAIVAHGTEQDPLFFYANLAALSAFGATLDQFIGMPSRLSAEAPLREERQALLDRVSAQGYIDDYAGIRVRLDGTRFPIANAVVWNLIDESGKRQGQAAAFSL